MRERVMLRSQLWIWHWFHTLKYICITLSGDVIRIRGNNIIKENDGNKSYRPLFDPICRYHSGPLCSQRAAPPLVILWSRSRYHRVCLSFALEAVLGWASRETRLWIGLDLCCWQAQGGQGDWAVDSCFERTTRCGLPMGSGVRHSGNRGVTHCRDPDCGKLDLYWPWYAHSLGEDQVLDGKS